MPYKNRFFQLLAFKQERAPRGCSLTLTFDTRTREDRYEKEVFSNAGGRDNVYRNVFSDRTEYEYKYEREYRQYQYEHEFESYYHYFKSKRNKYEF